MDEDTGGLNGRAGRIAVVVLWVWLAATALFALLSGMAADGCADATCDTRVQTGWLVLLVVEAAIIVTAAAVGRRLPIGARLGLLAGAGALSPAAIAAFLAYAGRYV